MSASVSVVGPVTEGSIVVLSGVDVGMHGKEIVEVVRQMAGHDQFAVLWLSDGGDVEVWGQDTDVKARVQQLLGQKGKGKNG